MRAIAQRYASALVEVAIEGETAEKTRGDLAEFLELQSESVDLRNFLASPSIPRREKHALIAKLVGRLEASEILRNFLYIIADNRRIQLLPEIYQEYVRQQHERLRIVEAEILTAQALNEQEKADLMGTLERLTGKKVEAQYLVDSNLIGGAVVRMGSTVYDGSLREQLELMMHKMAGE